MTTAYRFGNAQLLADRRRLLVDGQDSRIGARAFDLLLALLERRERTVSKSELLDAIWPGMVVEEGNLQVHVSSLRKVLGPGVIATIPGRGYRFTGALLDAPEGGTNGVAATSEAPSPAALEASAHLGNLPAELPELFGRGDELAVLRSLTESHRLVTVVGAGGIGKTSLAQALAQGWRGALEDGVWWVELAPLSDASLVTPTVVGTLGGTLGADASIESFAKSLGASRMLIVLDNCEHLLQAVAELAAAFLRAAPKVRLLATSQEPLKIAQEQVYRLGPLALPHGGKVDAARQAGAVALFEARARAAEPSFVLGEHNVADVVEICRRLDGIALAIELAAARVPLLGVPGLRARLDERFRVLTGGARLALQRHQTLRAAIDWSHGLLTCDEQTVFRRLAVFVGSFGLESAQHVAAADHLDRWAVLESLGGLVDKSLVVAETGADPRYRLLETSRAFALEMLSKAQENQATLRRHAEALLMVFEDSLKSQYTMASQAHIDRYLRDLDNARAALDWAAGPGGDPQLQVALAGSVGWIWYGAGLRPEGLRRTAAAMDRLGPATPPWLEARLLASWSSQAHPSVGAKELAAIARAIDLYRQLGDRRSLFVALCWQARLQPYCGLLDEADRSAQEAAQLLEADWPAALRVLLLRSRANLSDVLGQFEEASQTLEDACQLAIAQGDTRMLVRYRINQEQAVAALGHLDESVARGRELMNLLRDAPSLRNGLEHFVIKNLLMSLARLGAVEEAQGLARRARAMFDRFGVSWELLEPCALIAFKQGRVGDAARLLGRVDGAFGSSDLKRDPVEQMLRDDLVQQLNGALSVDELARLMAEGLALAEEEALFLAFGSA